MMLAQNTGVDTGVPLLTMHQDSTVNLHIVRRMEPAH